METLWQFRSIEGTPRLHPSPAPHPTPRRALPGLRTPGRCPGAPGLGRGPSLPGRKTFPGIFLRGLVSDWAFLLWEGRRSIQVAFLLGRLFLPRLCSPSPGSWEWEFQLEHPQPRTPTGPWRPGRRLWVSSPLCRTAPAGGKLEGAARRLSGRGGWASGAAPARRSFLPRWVPVRWKQAQEPSPRGRLRLSGRSEA